MLWEFSLLQKSGFPITATPFFVETACKLLRLFGNFNEVRSIWKLRWKLDSVDMYSREFFCCNINSAC